MTDTRPFENRYREEFSNEFLQSQTNPGETKFLDIVQL